MGSISWRKRWSRCVLVVGFSLRLSWHWRFGCFTVDLLCRCCVCSWGCRGILLPHSGDTRQRGLRPHDPHGNGHGRLFRHGSVFHHRSDWGEQGLYCIGPSSCSSLREAVDQLHITHMIQMWRWCHRCMCFPHETPVSVLWHLPTPGMRRTREVEQFSLSNGNAILRIIRNWYLYFCVFKRSYYSGRGNE